MIVNWTVTDQEFLQTYLVKTDYKLIEALKSKLPAITAKSFEEIALEAQEKKGAEDKIQDILDFAEPRQPQTNLIKSIDPTVGLPK